MFAGSDVLMAPGISRSAFWRMRVLNWPGCPNELVHPIDEPSAADVQRTTPWLFNAAIVSSS